MKCAIVLGTRAELIKMFPVIEKLREQNHEVKFIHTGQHDLSDTCKTFNIEGPDVILSNQPDSSSQFNGSTFSAIKWNIGLTFRLRKEISSYKPDHVLYHGDTMSTALGAIVCSRFFFPFRHFETNHIEAGLRSGSLFEPFPEEISRRLTDLLSKNLFSVSKTATKNLSLHKIAGKKVVEVGNTIVDSVERALQIGEDTEKPERYGIVTVHRHENISSKKRMEKIISILEKSPRHLLFPLHDNTRSVLRDYGLYERLAENEGIELIELVDYPDFLHLIKDADILYTDGGSIQEESLIFKVPCVLLRNRTERVEGLTTGINYLSKFNVEKTVEKAQELVEEDFSSIENPYGPPGVSEEIVRSLEPDA